jgi:hypothetical protein
MINSFDASKLNSVCVMSNPPLRIRYMNSSNGSFDEMEMDDLFEKHLDGEGDGEEMENGGTGEIDGEWEEDDDFSEHHVDHTEHRPADTFGTSGHDVHNQNSSAGNRQVHGHGANTLNQTRPPKGPSQTGKRTITTASKRTSGDALSNFADRNFDDVIDATSAK